MKNVINLSTGRASVSRLDRFVLALFLAFSVIVWEHLLHFFVLLSGGGDTFSGHLVHMLRDGLMTLPLAYLSVAAGLRFSPYRGMRNQTWLRTAGQATSIALSFGLLLVPSIGIHSFIDSALSGEKLTLPPGALEGMTGILGLIAHGTHDALIGLIVALPISLLGLRILCRLNQRDCQQAISVSELHYSEWKPKTLRLALACTVLVTTAMGAALSSTNLRAQATEARVEFFITDDPGRWFDTGVDISGTRSLAVIRPGDEVKFSGKSNTVHTITSLIFPSAALGMPFDTKAMKVSASVNLQTPGLYVFTCKIHPYMFGAVIVDAPETPELDLGERISLVNGLTIPTASDLALRLLRTFFVATNPSNWQVHSATAASSWDPSYPPVSVLAFDENSNPVSVPDLNAFLHGYFNEPVSLAAATPPSTAGVGQVWVNTQFELSARKTKPGTATALDATTWQVVRKVALPGINMNNPHNMWTDKNQKLIYQTQWFDSKLAVFDRQSGKLLRNISVGEAPAHVMTRVDTDEVHVTLNGEDKVESVVELSPLARSVLGRIDIGRPHPHAHWMGHDGRIMVTPNAFTADTTKFDFRTNSIGAILPAGTIPIATGMMPDSGKYYVANLLDSTITVIDTASNSVIKTINLLANYDPITGAITGPVGGLPIQTPVSPHGRYMVTANTLTSTITVVDTSIDQVVAMLPCDPGCHGVQFGAKQGGGYFAYVSTKFSNALIVVDPDPNNDGDPSDATIAGRVLLAASSGTARDDTITGNVGMGGQGVLAIPVVYNGWVQKLPSVWLNQLTPEQRNPFP